MAAAGEHISPITVLTLSLLFYNFHHLYNHVSPTYLIPLEDKEQLITATKERILSHSAALFSTCNDEFSSLKKK